MLRQRIITAIALGLGLVVTVLWMPRNFTLGVFAMVILIGAYEWSAFPRFRALHQRYVFVFIMAVVMAAAWEFTRKSIPRLEVFLWFTAAWWLIAFLWVSLAPARHNRITATVCGFLVLVPAWVALAYLYQSKPAGPKTVLYVLALVWAADIGAFFAGRALGRVKLAPRVSPSKTWEGVLGGLIFGAVVAALGAQWLRQPPLGFICLSMAVVLVSIVGDLTESMFKRYAGVKDSGSLFPGHGGVLDRIDSVTAAAPMFLLGAHMLEYIR